MFLSAFPLATLQFSEKRKEKPHAIIPSFKGAGYGTRTRALSHVGSAIALNLDFQAPRTVHLHHL